MMSFRKSILCAVAITTLPSMLLAAESSKIKHSPNKVLDQYIVVLEDDTPVDQVSEIAENLTKSHNAELVEVWTSAVKGFYAKMTENRAEAMSQRKEVKYIEENARMFSSVAASQRTYVNPTTCDPTTQVCSSVVDNRLWHLDRADQISADPNNDYRYCTTGSGVTVYVVDTGVNKFHNEFNATPNRVQTGFNSSGDSMPANDPCMGFALAPTGFYEEKEGEFYFQEVFAAGHGTTVAAALGGKRVGIAKDVTIVPIKTARCDHDSARARISAHAYLQNETMFRPNSNGDVGAIYRALNSGTTAGTDPFGSNDWPSSDNVEVQDGPVAGGVKWKAIPFLDWFEKQTVQMVVSGLNWILSAANPGPKSYAIVTMSTWRQPSETGVAGSGNTLEQAVRNLLANNITVIASANNQNGNACDTSPARLSLGNPDSSVRSDVITVGGSMLLNRPWALDISDVSGSEADGGGKGVQPAFNWKAGVRDGRWICGGGDAATCFNTSGNCPGFADLSKCTVSPTTIQYPGFTGFLGGSNGGPCVTLFAPAKNLFLASTAGANQYRDARLNGQFASGTSFSAPIAAGFAARVMEAQGNLTPAQMRTQLLNSSGADLDPETLNTYDYLGNVIPDTPNKLLHLSDVSITAQPQSGPAAVSGPTLLTVGTGGTSTRSFQWYEVDLDDGGNPGFDAATYKRGAHPPESSVAISGATATSYNAPASSVTKAYWVRATNSCGSADSDIAAVVPRPTAPSNVVAALSGSSATVTWSAGGGVEQYEIQRKIAGQVWATAGFVGNSTFSFTETPVAPGGIVVYRVRSTAGSAYLPPQNLAVSDPSNNDFVNLNAAGYEALDTPNTTIKAQHLVELRQAVNNLCDAVGAAQEFSSGELLLASLQGASVLAADFTSLMTKINNIRTNSLLGVGSASFTSTPAIDDLVFGSQLQSLRNALQ